MTADALAEGMRSMDWMPGSSSQTSTPYAPSDRQLMEAAQALAATLPVAALLARAALADELAHWGAQLAHLALGLKTGRDLDHVIGEWKKAVAKWEASR